MHSKEWNTREVGRLILYEAAFFTRVPVPRFVNSCLNSDHFLYQGITAYRLKFF